MIDAKQAVALIEQAVQTYGAGTRYVDHDGAFYAEAKGCRYVNDEGAGMCLIGVVLIENALATPGVLEQINMLDFSQVADELHLDMSTHAVSVFCGAQKTQDDGGTWGEALDAARSIMLS